MLPDPVRDPAALRTTVVHAQESPQWDEWIQQAFDAFDIDGSGLLSYNELNQMLCGEVCPVRKQSLNIC